MENKQIVQSLLSQENINSQIKTDDSLLQSHVERDKKYTALISTYNNYIEDSVKFKRISRWYSFFLIMILFTTLVVFSCIIIWVISQKEESTISDFISLATVSISLISAIIILPQKMIDFIYNVDEDKSIVDIIKSTQDYDKR